MNENQKPAKDVSRWNLSVIRLISGRTNPHQERLWWKSLASKTALETLVLQARLCLSGMCTKHVHRTIKHKHRLCSEKKDSHSWNMQNDLVSALVSGYPASSTSTLQPQQERCFLSLQPHLQDPSGDPCPAHYHSKRFIPSMLPKHSMYPRGTNP